MPDLKKLITLEALQAALPSWLKSSSKPSYTADEISDTNTTNKFVTSADKSTWNAKGTYSKPTGGIPKSDLSQLVQNSLDLADSALQSESDPTVPSWAKQTNKPSYTQDEVTDGTTYKRVTSTEKSTWNNKQSALTTTQMSAVNSGIDSTKVSQISTNQTNILYGLEKIGTNLIKPRDDLPTVVTALPEGLRVQRSNTTSSFAYVKCGTVYLESGKKYALYDATYAPTTKHHYFYVDCGGNGFIELSTPSLTATVQYGTGRTTGTYDIYTRIDANSTVDTISTPIICLESVWKQLEAYTPYGAPNYDLTRLQAEDRAALAEEIDAGAKNKIKYDMAQLAALNPSWIVSGSTIRPSSDTHITFTLNSDMSIRVQSDGSNAQAELCICTSNYSSVKAGTYVLSGCPTGGDSSTTYDLRLIEQSSPKKYNADVGLGKEITWSAQYSYTCNIMVRANQNIDITFKPMVCTKSAWKVSNKFVPYRPDWDFVGKDAMLSIQAKAANDTTFTFDISEYKGTASNRYRYGLLVGGYNASNPCLYHVFLNANNEATLTAVLPSGRTLTASTSGTALTITASDTMYGGLRLLWLD